MNRLYYGDNLHVLRDTQAFPDAFVDLIYLDPPFNSKRDYNLHFNPPPLTSTGESVKHEQDPNLCKFDLLRSRRDS